MNDESRASITADVDPSETDPVALLKKMQQQLNFLEKKIDVLISQSQPKPFADRAERPDRPFRKRPFSKPPRAFDRPRPHSREGRESGTGEREPAPRRFYDRFGPGKKRGANPKKKPYFSPRKDRE